MFKKDKKPRLIAGLAAILGSAAAALGVRSILRYRQDYGREKQRQQDHLQQRLRQHEEVRSAQGFPTGSQVVPATGSGAGTGPVGERLSSSVAETSTGNTGISGAFAASKPYEPSDQNVMGGSTTTETGRSQVTGSRVYQTGHQTDKERRPENSQTAATNKVNQSMRGSISEEQVSPLIQYLFSFRSMMNLLHSRRAAGAETGGRSLTSEDRAGYLETLRQLQEGQENNVSSSSGLPGHIQSVISQVRDAVTNETYTDDDLLRLESELVNEACRVLSEIRKAGAGQSTEFDLARQMFECRS